jgi:DNA-binding response OmpR family regulator
MESAILIFVVDDEPLIAQLLEDALREGGFSVHSASDGAEAIRMLEVTDAAYRALVTDVNLPPGELTGWDVAKRARELNAEIPVIYMTGAAADDWTSKGIPNSVLVAKPFAAAQIVTAVSQLLNQGNTPGV